MPDDKGHFEQRVIDEAKSRNGAAQIAGQADKKIELLEKRARTLEDQVENLDMARDENKADADRYRKVVTVIEDCARGVRTIEEVYEAAGVRV